MTQMKKIKTIALGVTLMGGLSACGLPEMISADSTYNYATITHTSTHVNATKNFNENNIGVGVGSEAPLRGSKWSFGVEGGAFQNSNNNLSIYGVSYFERDMLRESPRSLRVGFFSGYARYPAEAANVSGLIPAIGDYIPVAGLQATFPTFGPHEFRVRVSPGLRRSDAVIAIQSNFVF